MNRKINCVAGSVPVMLAALVFSLWIFMPGPAVSATSAELCGSIPVGGPDSGTDMDSDGFTDYQECYGFNTTSGMYVYGLIDPQGSPPAGQLAMDPQKKDVFVNLVRAAAGSLLPTNITNNDMMSFYATDLGLTVHIIDDTYYTGDRQLTLTQKAIRIGESTLNDTQTILGDVWHGTPNYRDGATIYTRRIINVVNKICTTDTVSCQTSSGGISGRMNVAYYYMKNVLAHEAGHASNLTTLYSTTNEWHYAQGAGTVMEKSIKSVSKRAPFIFYISTTYDPQDKAAPNPVFSGGANPTTTVNQFMP